MIKIKFILVVNILVYVQVLYAQNIEHTFNVISGINLQKENSFLSSRLGYRIVNVQNSYPIYTYIGFESKLNLNYISYGLGLRSLINQSNTPKSIYGILDIYCSNQRNLVKKRFDSPIQGLFGIGYNVDRKSSIELLLASNFLFKDLKSFINFTLSRNLSYKTKIKRKHLTKCSD